VDVVSMRPKERVRAVFDSDGAAILDAESGVISTLNQTGAYIWRHLMDGETAEQITQKLARETGEPPDSVEQDVKSFLDRLLNEGLLERQ
jgi:hypothetical protein